MVKSEAILVIAIWDEIRDYIPGNKRYDTAISLVRSFEEYGFESKDLHDIIDEDSYLARAYHDVFDEPEVDIPDYAEDIDD